MTRVAVETRALARWTADAARPGTRLTTALTEADDAVRSMVAAWDGEAAQRFEQHFRQWRGAADRDGLDTEVDDIRVTVTTLSRASSEMADAIGVLSAALAGTGAMAGDDAEGPRVRPRPRHHGVGRVASVDHGREPPHRGRRGARRNRQQRPAR